MKRVDIRSRDYWFKVVEFLHQNWALIDADADGRGCAVYFVHDASGVFDRMSFRSPEEAARALRWNGFERFEEDPSARKIMAPPAPPFREDDTGSGAIYSSGRFWLEPL